MGHRVQPPSSRQRTSDRCQFGRPTRYRIGDTGSIFCSGKNSGALTGIVDQSWQTAGKQRALCFRPIRARPPRAFEQTGFARIIPFDPTQRGKTPPRTASPTIQLRNCRLQALSIPETNLFTLADRVSRPQPPSPCRFIIFHWVWPPFGPPQPASIELRFPCAPRLSGHAAPQQMGAQAKTRARVQAAAARHERS